MTTCENCGRVRHGKGGNGCYGGAPCEIAGNARKMTARGWRPAPNGLGGTLKAIGVPIESHVGGIARTGGPGRRQKLSYTDWAPGWTVELASTWYRVEPYVGRERLIEPFTMGSFSSTKVRIAIARAIEDETFRAAALAAAEIGRLRAFLVAQQIGVRRARIRVTTNTKEGV